MKIKDGVILSNLDIRMRPALISGDSVWKQFGQELVVTAGLDGTHWAGSLHYYGLALDFRINYWNGDWKEAKSFGLLVQKKLQDVLGVSFRVLLENTHIHVEYNIDRR